MAQAELTFENIRSQIAEETGNETTEAKARIGRIVNTFYLRLCGKRDWDWLYKTDTFDTVAAQQDYTGSTIFSSALQKILWMYYDSGGTRTYLHEKSLKWFDNLASPGSSGDPYAYITYEWADQLPNIKLVYVPTSVISVYYRCKKIISSLSADGDVPLIPIFHRPILINYGAMIIYKKQGDTANFKLSEGLYLEDLLSLYGDTSPNRQKGLRLHSSVMGDIESKYPEEFGNLGDYA